LWFILIAYNGTWFFCNVSDFLPDYVPPTTSKRKSTEESSLHKTDAKWSHSALPKKASANRDALMPVFEGIATVEQMENGLPCFLILKEIGLCSYRCRSAKCKKARKYACYSEAINKKPAWCSGCKSFNDICAHFQNLKAYLQTNNKLQQLQVDSDDDLMCEVFLK
jgi:hypothetical protein